MSVDRQLEREQGYLAHARGELARMRAQTLSLQAHGGDRVSSEYLAATLNRRALSLVDDPATALFFGRIDQREPDGETPASVHRWYIGRRHVADAHGDPVVIDWRAEVSTAFYRASPARPMGVELRRRFGTDRGELTAYEDERLLDATHRGDEGPGGASQQVGQVSRILAAEIERPRVGPMRDIVATIQPEQDEIVRADAGITVCVQGAPGTGKTAVGLHRAAWLLYAFRDRLARAGVLVIGPNRAFLDHIGAVLPALGEVEVRHTTIEDLTSTVAVRGVDDVSVAVLKGDPRVAEVLRRAVWAAVNEPSEPLVLPRGSRKWRVPVDEVAQILVELKARAVRYEAARAMLPRRLAHAVLLQMEAAGDSPDDRVQDAVARSPVVRRYAAGLWPVLDPRTLLFDVLRDPETLRRHAEGVLSEDEQALLVWRSAPRSRAAARWSPADAVLLDEVADLLDRTPSLGHVILDEAQDLSPMQLRAVGRRCSTGAATVLGDIAQGTTPWATESWQESLAHLGKPDGVVEVLDRGFRVPARVIDFAVRLLPSMAPGLAAPTSVRDNPGRLDVERVTASTLLDRLVAVTREMASEPGSVGVIVADDLVNGASKALRHSGIQHGVLGMDHGDVTHQVDVVPAPVAKGLEFDRVVVVEPAQIAASEPDRRTGLRRLYVILTRAVSELTVLHAEDLPVELAAAETADVPALTAWWTTDLAAVAPHAAPEDVARAAAELLGRWGEPARRYHTTTHLVEMFWALEELLGAGEVDQEGAVVARLAGWLHDAVYDPEAGAGANEEASSALARTLLGPLHVPAGTVDAVVRLVRLTSRHEVAGSRLDNAFQDSDLWILSADRERFDEYCAQVREEFAAVPDPAYRKGRSAILAPFLRRTSVYRTPHARAEWEPQARVNLARELDRLG